jgi:hypothetical protein
MIKIATQPTIIYFIVTPDVRCGVVEQCGQGEEYTSSANGPVTSLNYSSI